MTEQAQRQLQVGNKAAKHPQDRWPQQFILLLYESSNYRSARGMVTKQPNKWHHRTATLFCPGFQFEKKKSFEGGAMFFKGMK